MQWFAIEIKIWRIIWLRSLINYPQRNKMQYAVQGGTEKFRSNIIPYDYYSAGYFLIRKNKRLSWLDEPVGLVPDEIISLQVQFCPKFHLSRGWGSDNRSKALNFGMTN
jgi:hypothetical protein